MSRGSRRRKPLLRRVRHWLVRLYERLVECPRGAHTRSRRHVRRVGEHWVSRCRACGQPMWRQRKNKWTAQD